MSALLAECHPDRVVKDKVNRLCSSCYGKKWSQANPRPWQKRNWRRSFSRRKYGVTEEQYLTLHEQGCAICKLPFRTDGHEPVFDHNHTTGAFRGLLCQKCNRGIGLLQDSPDVLEEAAAYVRNEARRPRG